jgi:hypothetical protein
VTSSQSGPVESLRTGDDGRFHFRLPPPDTSGFTVYFTTAEYLTVRYFGAPIHPGAPTGAYTVEVHDTTSHLPGAIRTARRDVGMAPVEEGGWEVNELVRVRNTGEKTLMPDPERGSWELKLPEGATDFETGEGDVAPTQVRLVKDRMFLLAPLTPGDRDLFLRYRLPARPSRSELAVAAPTDTLNVYVRQPAPEMTVTGLGEGRSLDVQGEKFLQYSGTAPEDGRRVSLEWTAVRAAPASPVVAGLVAAVVVLLLGSWAALRGEGRPGLRA